MFTWMTVSDLFFKWFDWRSIFFSSFSIGSFEIRRYLYKNISEYMIAGREVIQLIRSKQQKNLQNFDEIHIRNSYHQIYMINWNWFHMMLFMIHLILCPVIFRVSIEKQIYDRIFIFAFRYWEWNYNYFDQGNQHFHWTVINRNNSLLIPYIFHFILSKIIKMRFTCWQNVVNLMKYLEIILSIPISIITPLILKEAVDINLKKNF